MAAHRHVWGAHGQIFDNLVGYSLNSNFRQALSLVVATGRVLGF
jgi:hypothetical protein